VISSVNYLELVVIGEFQCAKSGHKRDFRKPARTPTEAEKEDESGETRTYGNHTKDF